MSNPATSGTVSAPKHRFEADAERELSQLRRAERLILVIRWTVWAAWLPIVWGTDAAASASTWAVFFGVAAYAALTQVLVRRSRDIRRTAIATMVGDSVGVACMCFATGGITSDVYPYFYLHLLTTSIRFGVPETAGAFLLDGTFSLALTWTEPQATTRDLALRLFYLSVIGIVAGLLSLDARRHYRRSLRAGNQAGLLLSVNREITATLEVGEVLVRILRELLQTLPCRGASIVLLDGQSRGAERIVVAGGFPEPTPEKVRASLEGGPLEAGRAKPGAMLALSASELLPAAASQRTLAVVPIDRRRRLGFLIAGDRIGGGEFSSDERDLLLAVADQSAVAIENARLLEEAHVARDQRQEMLRQLIRAEEEERKRLAGEIHDRMGRRIFELLHGIERCREHLEASQPGNTADLHLLTAEARALSDEIRNVMDQLRPPSIDDLGFAEGARDFLTSLDESLAISLRIDDAAEVSRPEVNVMLFRILQEAVWNVRKHAAATRLFVDFRPAAADGVELVVRDDGRGFDASAPPPRGHYGLLYMKERAEACGGRFEVRSRPGEGAEIRVTVPAV